MAEKVVAILTLIVEYSELPNMEDIESLVDTARSYGEVTHAELIIKAETKVTF